MPIVYKGRVFSVEVGTRRFPNGREHEVAIVRHRAVGRADPDRGRWPRRADPAVPAARSTARLWELPAGSVNPGESAEAAARARVRGGDRPRAAPHRAARRPVSRAGVLRRGADLLPRVGSARAAAGLAAQAGRRRRHHHAAVHDRRSARDGGARRDRRSEDGLRADADLDPMSEFAVQTLLDTPTIAIHDVCCQGSCRHQSAEECTAATQVVFPYRGVYVRHLGQDQAVAEANQVLFFNAAEGYRVSHPVPGGDASLDARHRRDRCCTSWRRRLFCATGGRWHFGSSACASMRGRRCSSRLLRHSLREEYRRTAGGRERWRLTLVRRALGPRTTHAPGASVGTAAAGGSGQARAGERSGAALDAGRDRRRGAAAPPSTSRRSSSK